MFTIYGFEFQFLRNVVKIKSIFAREIRHIIKCELEDFAIEFRCSLYLSNTALKNLPKIYGLPVEKLSR